MIRIIELSFFYFLTTGKILVCMFEKLQGVEERFNKVEQLLSDPEILRNRSEYEKFSKEHAQLNKIVTIYREYKKIKQGLLESTDLLDDSDPEIKALAKEEILELEQQLSSVSEELQRALLPKDPNDNKNTIIEIRAGTGGEEAALFASDLFRMYSRYVENSRWKIEIITHNTTGTGGLKEVIAMVYGKDVYSRFKYESGTHRVQRVPATETQGRVHTSAVTVAVLPEAEEVELNIDPSEIKIDVYRSTGPGGQSVNTTDSAVRLTHLPTGLVVTCQDEKSQHKNRAKAMKVLRARLYDSMMQKINDERSSERRSQVGTGDRSGRIRTYNFPQGRMTDHRIGLTLYKLESIMQGDIDEIINALITYHQSKALENQGSVLNAG